MSSASSLIRANEGDYEENMRTVFDHELMSVDHKLWMKYIYIIHPSFLFLFFFPVSFFRHSFYNFNTPAIML